MNCNIFVRSFVLIHSRHNGSERKKCARVMMRIISEGEEWFQSSIVTTIHFATACQLCHIG